MILKSLKHCSIKFGWINSFCKSQSVELKFSIISNKMIDEQKLSLFVRKQEKSQYSAVVHIRPFFSEEIKQFVDVFVGTVRRHQAWATFSKQLTNIWGAPLLGDAAAASVAAPPVIEVHNMLVGCFRCSSSSEKETSQFSSSCLDGSFQFLHEKG